MLVQLQNPAYANERVGVNKNTYTADSKGVVVAEPADAKVMIDVGGWQKIGEVEADTRVRLPETPDEFLAACRRINLTPQDLRSMADFLEAHESVDMLPAEPPEAEDPVEMDEAEELEPEELELEAEPTEPEPEPAEQDDLDASLDPLEPIGDAEDEIAGNGDGKTKRELLDAARDMGVFVDGRWGKQKILDAIEARSTT